MQLIKGFYFSNITIKISVTTIVSLRAICESPKEHKFLPNILVVNSIGFKNVCVLLGFQSILIQFLFTRSEYESADLLYRFDIFWYLVLFI